MSCVKKWHGGVQHIGHTLQPTLYVQVSCITAIIVQYAGSEEACL